MPRFLRKFFRRRTLQRDLETELAFHRERSGERRFGNTARIKEEAFDLWRFNFLENLSRDLIYAARGLRRSPALLCTALLSLGLGIGVNTAMFSLGVQFLFSEPSVRDAASLVNVRVGRDMHSPRPTLDFIAASGLFAEVTGEKEESVVNYNDGVDTHRAFNVYTTKNYFTALGIPMLYGRGIEPADPDTVAVLSYGFWHKYFGGDRSVVGRAINLDGRACTVVGVLPPHFRTLSGYGFAPDIYMPRYREDTFLNIFARLKPGTTRQAALAGLRTVVRRMNKPAEAEQSQVVAVAGVARLQADNSLTVGLFFALLLVIVSLVLLIACINVASLLLARAAARRREISTRLALGAGRARVLQQFLAESLLLSLAGSLLGLAFAQIATMLLARVHIPVPLPIELDVQPDWRVAIYAALLTTFAAVACGLLPALKSMKQSLLPDLHREGRMRLRRALVAAQIAASVIVLATGLLFLRNLAGASAINPGFDVVHTLRADVNLPAAGFADPARKTAYINRVLRELAALPGVVSVAAAHTIPFTDANHESAVLTFSGSGQRFGADFNANSVTPGFFDAMNIPVRAGRSFAAENQDHEVIVNRTFAERYLAGRPPVGAVFLWGGHGDAPFRIAGVVEDTKTMTIGEPARAQLYESLDIIPANVFRVQFVIRSAIPPALQLDAVRRALHGIEPLAATQVDTMYSTIGLAFFPSQVGAVLLGSLGVLGLLLATIGLYGVMVYSVARRAREIGVRVAVGASRTDISRMVLVDSTRLTSIGSAIGIFVAVFVTKPLAMFLVPGLKATDPLNFAAVLAVMIVTALAASWGPVRRALSVDPNAALRDE